MPRAPRPTPRPPSGQDQQPRKPTAPLSACVRRIPPGISIRHRSRRGISSCSRPTGRPRRRAFARHSVPDALPCRRTIHTGWTTRRCSLSACCRTRIHNHTLTYAGLRWATGRMFEPGSTPSRNIQVSSGGEDLLKLVALPNLNLRSRRQERAPARKHPDIVFVQLSPTSHWRVLSDDDPRPLARSPRSASNSARPRVTVRQPDRALPRRMHQPRRPGRFGITLVSIGQPAVMTRSLRAPPP